MAKERKRFSFPQGTPVQLHQPGTYTLTRLDDNSTLVELIDDNEHESEEIPPGEELISERSRL